MLGFSPISTAPLSAMGQGAPPPEFQPAAVSIFLIDWRQPVVIGFAGVVYPDKAFSAAPASSVEVTIHRDYVRIKASPVQNIYLYGTADEQEEPKTEENDEV